MNLITTGPKDESEKQISGPLTTLLQQSNFSRDPKANLVAGLTFSHLWYNSIQKEVQFHDSINQSNRRSAFEVQDSGSHSQPDANTSIRFSKIIEPEEEYEHIYMNSDESDQSGNVLQFPYTGNRRFGSVFYARGEFSSL
ncbi:Ran GTPase [Artemisia annua]|uniref:Ran GTPase n=1 Tax=Artemisia annua TaxID=35608 RepID=A0A2U1NVF5_ARTAN|nr:Ran GTPase [Artemisia annua]